MGLTIKQFDELKQKVDRLQRQLDRETGGIEQLMERLKEEFGFKTIKQAKAELEEMEQEIAKLERRFDKALKLFEQELDDHEREKEDEED